MNEFWQQRIEAQVKDALAAAEALPSPRRMAAMARACPFRKGTPLWQAWYHEVVSQRVARMQEEVR